MERPVPAAVSAENAIAVPPRARTAPQAVTPAAVSQSFACRFAKPVGGAAKQAPPQDILRFPFATGPGRSCCDVHFLIGQELRWFLRIVHHHAVDSINAQPDWIGANHCVSRFYPKCERVGFC